MEEFQGVTGQIVYTGIPARFTSTQTDQNEFLAVKAEVVYTGLAARFISTDIPVIPQPDITVPTIPAVPDATGISAAALGIEVNPIRRTDLEPLRQLGIPFRVIATLEEVINQSIEALSSVAESENVVGQATIDAINASFTAVNTSFSIVVNALNSTTLVANTANQTASQAASDIPTYATLIGMGNPEGATESNNSLMYIDTVGPTLYINTIGPQSLTGWVVA